MRNRTLYILFIITIAAGLFFAVYTRQPMGFVVAASAALALAYFIIRGEKEK